MTASDFTKEFDLLKKKEIILKHKLADNVNKLAKAYPKAIVYYPGSKTNIITEYLADENFVNSFIDEKDKLIEFLHALETYAMEDIAKRQLKLFK